MGRGQAHIGCMEGSQFVRQSVWLNTLGHMITSHDQFTSSINYSGALMRGKGATSINKHLAGATDGIQYPA